MQLQASKKEFADLGVNVAVMTYDAVELNAKFVKQYKITYPLLSDPKGQTAIAFGILNESYPEGHRAHGVPHPGIFFVSNDGVVLAKFAEESIRDRPEIEDVLKVVRQALKPQPM